MRCTAWIFMSVTNYVCQCLGKEPRHNAVWLILLDWNWTWFLGDDQPLKGIHKDPGTKWLSPMASYPSSSIFQSLFSQGRTKGKDRNAIHNSNLGSSTEVGNIPLHRGQTSEGCQQEEHMLDTHMHTSQLCHRAKGEKKRWAHVFCPMTFLLENSTSFSLGRWRDEKVWGAQWLKQTIPKVASNLGVTDSRNLAVFAGLTLHALPVKELSSDSIYVGIFKNAESHKSFSLLSMSPPQILAWLQLWKTYFVPKISNWKIINWRRVNIYKTKQRETLLNPSSCSGNYIRACGLHPSFKILSTST